MDEQRKRVAAFDELNRAIDNPIEMPSVSGKAEKSEAPAWPYDVFLRLPKSYGSAVKDFSAIVKEKVHSKTFPLARYSSGDVRSNTTPSSSRRTRKSRRNPMSRTN